MSLEYQILIAFALDLLCGDPAWLPHPVRLIGRFAMSLENPARRLLPPRTAGIAVALTVLIVTAITTGGIIYLAGLLHPVAGDAVSIYLLYTTMAARDLADHSRNVLRALLMKNLVEARKRVSLMVGRDTNELTEEGVVRATVESVAENTVDGVIAPLMLACIGGPVLAMVYKAASTLDSTFGYKNERYVRFGTASAKIDDAANYIPARLAVPLIALAALVTGMKAGQAYRVARRDGRNHASPNSAWSEAAFAGALGIQLGGPLLRKGVPVEMPQIGNQGTALKADHIRRANILMVATAMIAVTLFCLIRLMIGKAL